MFEGVRGQIPVTTDVEDRCPDKIQDMFKSIIKIAAGTLLFAGIHSLLASRAAKERALKLLGGRKGKGLYRPLYNALAIASFGGLGLYGIGLPDRKLYRVSGAPAWLMHSVQFCFLLYLVNGVRQIGFLKFAGITNFRALITGQSFIPQAPEGQGPILENGHQMKITGPFLFSRHPLNFGMLPIIWLMPQMTLNLAAFNLITTLYLIFGSVHEEKRLKRSYGQAYVDYQTSGINFFVPSVSHVLENTARRIKG